MLLIPSSSLGRWCVLLQRNRLVIGLVVSGWPCRSRCGDIVGIAGMLHHAHRVPTMSQDTRCPACHPQPLSSNSSHTSCLVGHLWLFSQLRTRFPLSTNCIYQIWKEVTRFCALGQLESDLKVGTKPCTRVSGTFWENSSESCSQICPNLRKESILSIF